MKILSRLSHGISIVLLAVLWYELRHAMDVGLPPFIPTHFDGKGLPDGWSSAATGLIPMLLIPLLLLVLLAVGERMLAKRESGLPRWLAISSVVVFAVARILLPAAFLNLMREMLLVARHGARFLPHLLADQIAVGVAMGAFLLALILFSVALVMTEVLAAKSAVELPESLDLAAVGAAVAVAEDEKQA